MFSLNKGEGYEKVLEKLWLVLDEYGSDGSVYGDAASDIGDSNGDICTVSDLYAI
jgi:hypothetical protein